MKITLKSVVMIAALTLLCGCARSVVTLDDKSTSLAPATSSHGPALKIVDVEDKRIFQLDPPEADIPSLKDGAIADKSLTARAIGRKRNGFGQAFGDLVLPEGDTVANHVQAALVNGFRQAGYQVLTPSDPGYDQAVPVKAQILQYWSWLHPAFSHVVLFCRAEVQFDTTLPALAETPKIMSEVQDGNVFIGDGDWVEIASRGLTSLTAKLAETLKAGASESQAGSTN